MLAHRLMSPSRGEDRADGLYVALPTMATSNAMFDRLAASHRHLFAAGAIPSIALVHGARDMHAGFRSAMLRGARDEGSYSPVPDSTDESDTTASAACAAWIADDRRRAFPGRCRRRQRGSGALVGLAEPAPVPAYARPQPPCSSFSTRCTPTTPTCSARWRRCWSSTQAWAAPPFFSRRPLPLAVRRRLADAFKKGLGERGEPHSPGPELGYPWASVCAPEVRTSANVAGRPGRGPGPSRAIPAVCRRGPGRSRASGPRRPGGALHPEYRRRRARRPCRVAGWRARPGPLPCPFQRSPTA